MGHPHSMTRRRLATALGIFVSLTLLGLVASLGAQGNLVRGNSGNRYDYTLNPMPKSVLIDSALFSVRGIAPATIDGLPHYHAGDVDQDGHPELYLMSTSGFGYSEHAPPVPLFVFEARPGQTVMLDPRSVFGTATVEGGHPLEVADFDQDGRLDIMMAGSTEASTFVAPNKLFLYRNGRFRARSILPKMSMHNGNAGDFDGDGDVDFIASAYYVEMVFTEGPSWGRTEGNNQSDGCNPPGGCGITGSELLLFLNRGNGWFKVWPIRFNQPVEGVADPDALVDLEGMNGGSGSVFGNFDQDPESEIVVVDNNRTDQNGAEIAGESESWIIDQIGFEARHAYGEFRPLPKPYLETSPLFTNPPPHYWQSVDYSHDVNVESLDIDNDGDTDILVSNLLWTQDPRDTAGVLQILENDGSGTFTDVTDSVLYNFNFGKSASHDPVYLDVNGDGFTDLMQIAQAAGGDETTPVYQTLPKLWSNEILINAGNGTFVSAFWDGFHELTLRHQDVFNSFRCPPPAPCSQGFSHVQRFDLEYYPYLLKDGRLGFVTHQGASPQGLWIDVRAKRKLYTGPRGRETASVGAPGYSEYFYLTEYPEVARLVRQRRYPDGLSHYLAVGRAQGRFAFAPGTHVHGNAGNNVILLREGNERAFGYAGNDLFRGRAGNDFFNGGAGTDTAIYKAARSAYQIARRGGNVIITALSTDEGRDTLVNVEWLRFADQTVAVAEL